MMLLDTNIISEIMKPSPNNNVITWLDQQDTSLLFIATITIAEISYGLNALSDGKRRMLLEDAFNKAVIDAFKYRILSFDEFAAHQCGKIMGRRKELGHPLSVLDGQIAAIAHVHRLTVVTRNIRDFADCGLNLFNPFE